MGILEDNKNQTENQNVAQRIKQTTYNDYQGIRYRIQVIAGYVNRALDITEKKTGKRKLSEAELKDLAAIYPLIMILSTKLMFGYPLLKHPASKNWKEDIGAELDSHLNEMIEQNKEADDVQDK